MTMIVKSEHVLISTIFLSTSFMDFPLELFIGVCEKRYIVIKFLSG